jgi:glycosyltransferase involved in cell wall biosynthesis
MLNKKVAVIGTVGIPAKYGGFETLTENLTLHLHEKIDFTVFCSSRNISVKQKSYNQAALFYLPLSANGIQSIPYDIFSLFWAATKCSTILILGVSGCISLPIFRLLYPRKRLVINIDGLEHKREKWILPIKKFLKYSEKLAVKYADEIIADNASIYNYLLKEYKCNSNLIAYGGDNSTKTSLLKSTKKQFNLPDKYAFKVCRIEPENNIHLVLEAFFTLKTALVIIGNWNNSKYGRALKEKYHSCPNIILLDPIYNPSILNQIRSNCFVYVHGHSAGGTNPSLVEAMFVGLPVIAYDISYNRETTYNKSLYFKTANELSAIMNNINEQELVAVSNKLKDVSNHNYKWEKIANEYYNILMQN